MTEIIYRTGDATVPKADGSAIIAHICNDLGRWGKGFVVGVSARWKQPELAYRDWYKRREFNDFGLGAVQFVQVAPDVHVANMIGQHGIRSSGGGAPIRYEAVDRALEKLAEFAAASNASVHMPRIGCGLAGGTWNRIEPLIRARVSSRHIGVVVYDLE
ncbi:macro domain-containing protein [Nocardia sp. CDC153]|uniref:macro domain-containing protein n=1 Tax=Nocardia sp. CDC153 TaxID=3112167 RepID=UPI002DBB4C35|nr:macro domain-containing protein [Nocardia sp. CDC153]MEC3953962.1 macro domain-containing protein [Nocardia sp. CDC153]